MGKKKNKNQQSKWRSHYRMVVINDDTFEERFSLKLNRLNVFVVTTLAAIILVALTTVIIAFTPLRELIPGYSDTQVKKNTAILLQRADSLETVIDLNRQQFDRIQMVLSGNITTQEYERIDSIAQVETANQDQIIEPIPQDSVLRDEVAREDQFNLMEGAVARTNFVFFTPVKGSISSNYNPDKEHYAVDITAAVGTPVKVAAAGTVIFAGFTTDTGYTIIVEHPYGLITAYKHLGNILASQNDQVLAGEVLGSIGNTGELTNGPHLHFELWSDGYPLDPTNFINFD